MKNWFQKIALTCAIIPLAQCAALPAGWQFAYAQTTESSTSSDAGTRAEPALWVMKDEDTTIYLFGTVHVLKPGMSWFDKAVKDAFDTSDELMLEVILPEDQAEMMGTTLPLAIDQSGAPLSSRLSPGDLAAYRAAMGAIGISSSQFDMFEPWFVAVTLSVLPLAKLGYDPEQGVEKQLTRLARQSGKPVAGLETLSQQLGFLDSLPSDVQVEFLNSVVRDFDKLGPMLDHMVSLWAKGDPDGLAAAMNESMASTPEVAAALLHERNARWADQLKARMDDPGTIFVAVGAGHLSGEKSLQDYLKERGFITERLRY